jgi:hypothetical protein
MWHESALDGEFFFFLFRIDRQIAERIRAAGCPCGGRLHQSKYSRKPRGLPQEAEEAFGFRFSFCCDRKGCRMRCTPPSVRFLGRRVYVGAWVVLACVLQQLAEADPGRPPPGDVPARTVRRWSRWWQTAFIASSLWKSERGRFMPPVSIERMPGSVLERFPGTPGERLKAMLLWLSPLSTDGCRSSFVMAG